MLAEVMEYLDLKNRSLIIDATLGLGGHSEAILSSDDFTGKIIGIDQDQSHLDFAKKRLEKFGDRFEAVKMNFSELGEYLDEQGIKFDGILFDLGLASPHLDMPERGFSFQQDALLDMRMDLDGELTAAEIVNEYSENQLTDIFHKYGEEKLGRRIARTIVEDRGQDRIETTTQLAELIKSVYKSVGFYRSKRHPATKVFQALRIAVNDELGVLEKALVDVVDRIEPGGRILVISYHSLEDRMVKHMFRREANPCTCPPKLPICACGKMPTLKLVTRKAVNPAQEEVDANPRARSARLRVGEAL